MDNSDNCCICFDPLLGVENKKLPCNHIMHYFCFSQYTEYCEKHKKNVTCPLCNLELQITIENPRSNRACCYLCCSLIFVLFIIAGIAVSAYFISKTTF